MPLTVEPASASDIPTFVDIVFASFKNPLQLAAFPDTPVVRKWWIDMLNDEIQDPNSLFLKVVDRAESSEHQQTEGTTIAVAKWNLPSTSPAPPAPSASEFPPGGDAPLAAQFFTSLSAAHSRIMSSISPKSALSTTIPHFYLELLATHPHHQRRGAGALLLDHVLWSADELGVACYLEASPVSVRLYATRGFEERERVGVEIGVIGEGEDRWEGGVYENVCMVREGRGR